MPPPLVSFAKTVPHAYVGLQREIFEIPCFLWADLYARLSLSLMVTSGAFRPLVVAAKAASHRESE
jgi:hypothetical protein